MFGHEIAGTVARLGPGVTRFRAGDRVVAAPSHPLRRLLFLRAGRLRPVRRLQEERHDGGFEPAGGGFAEYVKAMDWIVARGAIRSPTECSEEEAAFVEPVNTCLKAVRKADIGPGQTVLVVGQGPIGLLLTQLARWAGAEVLGSDTLPDRLEMSRRLGASHGLMRRA